jgi:hypothetical protein
MATDYKYNENVVEEIDLPSERKARLVKYSGTNQYGEFEGFRVEVGFYHNGEREWLISEDHSFKIPVCDLADLVVLLQNQLKGK